MSAGSVMKRGTSWRGRFRDENGRDRQRTFARRAEAQAWVNAQLASLASGQYVDPSAGSITFAAYAAQWLDQQHVRERTRALHEGRIRLYLVPVIGDVPLRSVRRSHVVEIVGRMVDAGLSPLVTKYAVSTLRAILESAVRDRLLVVNVAADSTIQMPRRERATGTLTADQVAQIVEQMEPRYKAMVVVGAASGLRPGELAGLTLDRCLGLAAMLTDGKVVDLAGQGAARRGEARLGVAGRGRAWRGAAGHGADPGEDTAPLRGTASVVLKVDRQIGSQSREFGPVKTSSSNRAVTIPASVAAVLVEHVREFGVGDGDLVFSTPTGRPLGSPHMSKAWAKATEGLGLAAGLTWHDLRHFHASSLLSDGVNIAAVAARLGHSSPSVTLQHYAWAMPSDEQRVLDASEAIAQRLA